jgi:hypothetical protein
LGIIIAGDENLVFDCVGLHLDLVDDGLKGIDDVITVKVSTVFRLLNVCLLTSKHSRSSRWIKQHNPST